MPITSWSTTAASNNSAPPNGAPEGMAPSSVNDVIRQIMADIAVEAQTGAVSTLNTIAGTDTITADMNPELTAYATGMIIKFTPANNNTGAATINIDGLGAKSIVKGDGTALIAGDLQASTIHVCIYDGTNFVLLNPIYTDADTLDGLSSASFAQFASTFFTATLTGMAASTQKTVYLRRTGNKVTLYVDGAFSGTSNSTSMTLTGITAGYRPAVTQAFPVLLYDNSALTSGWGEVNSSGVITFGVGAFGNFTSSGTKGLYDYSSFHWDIA